MRKLIIPILLLGIIYYFLSSGNDDTTTENKEQTTAAQTEKKTEASKTGTANLASNKLGITFDYPTAWGTIDSESTDAFVLVFDDACVGSSCDSLYVQKTTTTSGPSSAYPQLAGILKTLKEVKNRDNLVFYQDGVKKLFVDNKKDAIYTFEITEKTPSSDPFESIIDTFKETLAVSTATEIVTTSTVSDKTYKFQSCGDLANYAKETFYGDFVAQLGKVAAFSDPMSRKMYGSATLSPNDIRQACYSTEGQALIAVAPAGSNGSGDFHILKYDLGTKLLTEGRKSNDWKDTPGPTEFGKRDGRIIKMKGAAKGEGTCVKENSFEYDYLANTIAYKGTTEKNCQKPTETAPTSPAAAPAATSQQ